MLKSLQMPVVYSVIYDIVHYKKPLCMMKSQLIYKAFLLKAVMTFFSKSKPQNSVAT